MEKKNNMDFSEQKIAYQLLKRNGMRQLSVINQKKLYCVLPDTNTKNKDHHTMVLFLELITRVELVTSSLPRMCSTN